MLHNIHPLPQFLLRLLVSSVAVARTSAVVAVGIPAEDILVVGILPAEDTDCIPAVVHILVAGIDLVVVRIHGLQLGYVPVEGERCCYLRSNLQRSCLASDTVLGGSGYMRMRCRLCEVEWVHGWQN